MHEKSWSPFDPEWYNQAFDRFISTADDLFNQGLIAESGYKIPDADGSRSSVFRADAVLNNSFSERALRETLRDIYTNSTHKLMASNHDNVHFFKWHGTMSDVEYIPNTDYCQISIPTDGFIHPKDRDKYKLSQFYRKWFTLTDLLNNWDVFHWDCMVFIDQKIASEYEFRIDDHEVAIRFRYFDYWVNNNSSIDVYKFDTRFQCRVMVSKHQCHDEWDWKMPLDYIPDKRILNSDKAILRFNRIRDPKLRHFDTDLIDPTGDNLEFIQFKDGVIDLDNISKFNKGLIDAELRDSVWCSICVPTFLHEFPILLPTESIFRTYVPKFRKVYTLHEEYPQHVNAGELGNGGQVYVDVEGRYDEKVDGWHRMIRPIVLSDAFDHQHDEPLNDLADDVAGLKELTIKAADIIEEFRFYLHEYTTDERYNKYLDKVYKAFDAVHAAFNTLRDLNHMDIDIKYEEAYQTFLDTFAVIRRDGEISHYLNTQTTSWDNFWMISSPVIYMAREFVDRYVISDIVAHIPEYNKIVWEDKDEFMNRIRFQRPIDTSDFWTFAYYPDDRVWRPCNLEMEHKFPDVYIPSDPNEVDETANRVFKAFFFYSDTINVLKETIDATRPTASWDTDVQEYVIDGGGTYRDVFMEKFYWMAIQTIYRGELTTGARWEVLEHVIDNDSYRRFNELFMTTMDPYFKLGLATYLKSDNYGFPFDDAVAKMQEAINADWLGYQKITNFEIYLNKSWVPSYFDYVTKILDDFDPVGRIIRRPRASFDVDRVIPILRNLQQKVFTAVNTMKQDADWILDRLNSESYFISKDLFTQLKERVDQMFENAKSSLEFTTTLDLQTYSIEDVNTIIGYIHAYPELIETIRGSLGEIKEHVESKMIYDKKREHLAKVIEMTEAVPDMINALSDLFIDFDYEGFMKSVNDLSTYLDARKINPDDASLIGGINQFTEAWDTNVKATRNNLFVSSTRLYTTVFKDDVYYAADIRNAVSTIDTMMEDATNLKTALEEYAKSFNVEIDNSIIIALDNTISQLKGLCNYTNAYSSTRNAITSVETDIEELLTSFNGFSIGETELGYVNDIKMNMDLMLTYLSYMFGTQHRREAQDSLLNARAVMASWEYFLNVENEVFDKMIEITNSPVPVIEAIDAYHEILEALSEYLDTVNGVFIPDASQPTYATIYSTTGVELLTGGFDHAAGDVAYIPNIGAYKIDRIDGPVDAATMIHATGCRTTQFRDPMIQTQPYDAITSGSGLGLTVKPIGSSKIELMGDDIADDVRKRVENMLNEIELNGASANPYANTTLEGSLSKVSKISEDWDNTLSMYSDHISDDVKAQVSKILEMVDTFREPVDQFERERTFVNLGEHVDRFRDLVILINRHSSDVELLNYSYYLNLIREQYQALSTFCGSGTSWTSGSQLRLILNRCKVPMRTFRDRIEYLSNQDLVKEITDSIDTMMHEVTKTTVALDNLANLWVPIASIIAQIREQLLFLTVIMKPTDPWYRITKVGIASFGDDYQRGDIIEIVPELPKDHNGDPDTRYESLVKDDVLLLKVLETEDGKVTKIVPLMDYAIPYEVWGIRDCITRSGKGHGLKVDIYSYLVTSKDCTLFRGDAYESPEVNPFDENDLMEFKFPNIHDLNVEYEIFIGGRQISEFIQKHGVSDDPKHPGEIDTLYVDANSVMNLRNSSVYIPAENYFIYRISDLEVIDPGAGYSVGQEIVVDAGAVAFRLKVASLLYSPYREIESVTMSDAKTAHSLLDNINGIFNVIPSDMDNIDDEFHVNKYDKLTKAGITKPATMSLSEEKMPFTLYRYDNMEDGDRNKNFMHPKVANKTNTAGDPDHGWYQGHRVDNSLLGVTDDVWNGIRPLIPHVDPVMEESLRIPPDGSYDTEYQEICRGLIHHGTSADPGNFSVPDITLLPMTTDEYPDGRVGRRVIVESDASHNGHRMMYPIIAFVALGHFVYGNPVEADESWRTFDVDWMNMDWYPDAPSTNARYKTAGWDTKSSKQIELEISNGLHKEDPRISKKRTFTYIHDLTVDDLSVFNWTTRSWEDLHNANMWELTPFEDPDNQKYGFTLSYLGDGEYSYDMSLYLNKSADSQQRNARLKRNAMIRLASAITKEVNTPEVNTRVNTGTTIRIRKLFPYEQKNSFTLGITEDGDRLGYEMNVRVNPYIHFKNEIHLEDIKIYNKSAGRFENVLDQNMFEVRFKDDKAVSRGMETHTRINSCVLANPGSGFVDGDAWAYNVQYNCTIFGTVTVDYTRDGVIETFVPIHVVNMPTDSPVIPFMIYQTADHWESIPGQAIVEFITETVEMYGDGYLHNVVNPYAPVPDEFKIIVQYNLDSPTEYDVIISKPVGRWKFVEPNWAMSPTFHIDGVNVNRDSLYLLTEKGRFPLINPSTGKPSITVKSTVDGTDVTFMNMYRRYETIRIQSVPYPMRSVYVQRNIPKSGYIDLSGKLNKPLNKKYFEFWVNGKLLFDEVTIITPTKIFLHGLKSLKNLEIVEVNRDPNEYFSDLFLEQEVTKLSNVKMSWNYRTYLDDALEGKLEDNYTPDEQAQLLTPVWPQVNESHPEYKNYPPNVDVEEDILVRTNSQDYPIKEIDNPSYYFMIINTPTIEGKRMSDRNVTFERLGLKPISDEFLVDLMNDEWKEEIARDPYFPIHAVMTEDEWYGMAVRLYDRYGIRVHNLNDAAYSVYDDHIIRINSNSHMTQLAKHQFEYDLT